MNIEEVTKTEACTCGALKGEHETLHPYGIPFAAGLERTVCGRFTWDGKSGPFA